jgi:hypothetical protein
LKTSIRWWSRLAFVAGLGLSALVACSSDSRDAHSEEKQKGSLSLALQARAPSGSVYMLRNAFFQITNVRTGETVAVLTSEDGLPDQQELSTLLLTGDYTVTLQPDWFLERISGPNPGGFGGSTGTAGMPAFGGTFTAGTTPIEVDGGFAQGLMADASAAALKAVKSDKGEGGAGPIDGGGEGPGELAGSGPGEFGGTGPGEVGGSGPIVGGAGPGEPGGAPPIGGSGGGLGRVDAQLLDNAVQFFSIFSAQDSFVHYQFKVGGEVVDFTKGRVHVTIGVEEDPGVCTPPDGVTMPERMLLETNTDALQNVSLLDVFAALATNGGHEGDPLRVYQQIFDSYASAELAQLPDGAHCGDELTNGAPSLNGYPIVCDRTERLHVNDPESFRATAFVNRIDLAPANGAHCGQQRMIFASNSLNRAFMIIEAQIPNPAPELGIDGCRPLAQFWLDQNAIPDPKLRGERLARAFLSGAPELAEAGFGAFYTAENLTVGSGQIRTNQFDSDPWTLREFKLALDGAAISAVPFPVAESPNGQLWNENVPLAQGDACRESFLNAAEGLLSSDLARLSFVVDGACKDAESRNDGSQNYAAQLSDGFRGLLEERLVGTGLSADDIANRAQFGGSCMGCHQEASGKPLGNGLRAPFSNDFPQVTEFATACTGGEAGSCFPPSETLRSLFLPSRMQVMSNLLGFPVIVNPCDGGGGGSAGGGSVGGSVGTAGSSVGGSGPIGTAGAVSMGGSGGIDFPLPPGESEPAPVIVTELPSVQEPIEQMQEEDAEIRDQYGDVTLSGRSAKVTH